jgi:hypothetical protein
MVAHMNIMKFLTLALICPGFVIIALFGGLWWLIGNSWGQGAISVIGLWALAFNKLPTQGLECLKDKFNMRFFLPLAILSTIGFSIGFFIKS